jgi:hypothetical protein
MSSARLVLHLAVAAKRRNINDHLVGVFSGERSGIEAEILGHEAGRVYENGIGRACELGDELPDLLAAVVQHHRLLPAVQHHVRR